MAYEQNNNGQKPPNPAKKKKTKLVLDPQVINTYYNILREPNAQAQLEDHINQDTDSDKQLAKMQRYDPDDEAAENIVMKHLLKLKNTTIVDGHPKGSLHDIAHAVQQKNDPDGIRKLLDTLNTQQGNFNTVADNVGGESALNYQQNDTSRGLNSQASPTDSKLQDPLHFPSHGNEGSLFDRQDFEVVNDAYKQRKSELDNLWKNVESGTGPNESHQQSLKGFMFGYDHPIAQEERNNDSQMNNPQKPVTFDDLVPKNAQKKLQRGGTNMSNNLDGTPNHSQMQMDFGGTNSTNQQNYSITVTNSNPTPTALSQYNPNIQDSKRFTNVYQDFNHSGSKNSSVIPESNMDMSSEYQLSTSKPRYDQKNSPINSLGRQNNNARNNPNKGLIDKNFEMASKVQYDEYGFPIVSNNNLSDEGLNKKSAAFGLNKNLSPSIKNSPNRKISTGSEYEDALIYDNDTFAGDNQPSTSKNPKSNSKYSNHDSIHVRDTQDFFRDPNAQNDKDYDGGYVPTGLAFGKNKKTGFGGNSDKKNNNKNYPSHIEEDIDNFSQMNKPYGQMPGNMDINMNSSSKHNLENNSSGTSGLRPSLLSEAKKQAIENRKSLENSSGGTSLQNVHPGPMAGGQNLPNSNDLNYPISLSNNNSRVGNNSSSGPAYGQMQKSLYSESNKIGRMSNDKLGLKIEDDWGFDRGEYEDDFEDELQGGYEPTGVINKSPTINSMTSKVLDNKKGTGWDDKNRIDNNPSLVTENKSKNQLNAIDGMNMDGSGLQMPKSDNFDYQPIVKKSDLDSFDYQNSKRNIRATPPVVNNGMYCLFFVLFI